MQGGGSSSKGGATSDTSSSVTPKTTKPTTSSKTTAPTSSSAASETTAPASSSVVVEATVPTDYEDPRKLARVKRPISYTIMQPEKRNIDKPRISSRFFRFWWFLDERIEISMNLNAYDLYVDCVSCSLVIWE